MKRINIKNVLLSEAIMTLVDWEDRLIQLCNDLSLAPVEGIPAPDRKGLRLYYKTCAAWSDAVVRIKKRDEKGK